MTDEAAAFDEKQAHRRFSAECFNCAWEFMEKEGRTASENEEMLAAAFASLWHWTHRQDRTEKNLSVGYWQISRICAMLKRGEESLRYGELSLRHSSGAEPFYVGYAHEAIARAAKMLGKQDVMQEHVRLGLELAAVVADAEERETLKTDLQGIESKL